MKQFKSIALILVGVVICCAAAIGGFFAITDIAKAMDGQGILITIVLAVLLLFLAVIAIVSIIFGIGLVNIAVNVFLGSDENDAKNNQVISKDMNLDKMNFMDKSEFLSIIAAAKTDDGQPLFDDQTKENIQKVLDTKTDFSAQLIYQKQKEKELFLEAKSQLDEFIKDVGADIKYDDETIWKIAAAFAKCKNPYISDYDVWECCIRMML